ncbi:ABC transporter substrate-binding protein [Nesterenkonia sp. MY13]|uniref:ABC transporter substrate-binding protein n=1 Tax=Nesterenkonia sedimenti TaxID=1463632 RepID=A0A7X8TL30_9MICC|nr:ABC transporter substrate-binding protein [Nesterenkonia sedimenti]NLS10767.1 ABC transporter substrate-binding protein [Nesterenkonia sedimenti]
MTATATLSALSLLAACGTNQGGSGPAGDSGDPGDIVTGGTLRVAVGSDAGCVDPHQVVANDSIYSLRQLVDSLTDQDPETGEIVPWLAQEWEINDDATEFSFTLQEGATFSNGEPVDSEAVAANFDAAVELGARATLPNDYLTGYQETEVHDELNFTVHFEDSNAQFLQATSTHSLGILAPETTALDEDARCQEVIGSGPFVLEEYVQGQQTTLSAREDYAWGSTAWENQGEAHVDALEFSVVSESGVRAGLIQSNQADLIAGVGHQDIAQLESAEAQLLSRNNPGIAMGLNVNHEHPVLGEQPVREAISHAIDREDIVETLFTEFTPAATSVLASTTPDHVDISEYLSYDPQGVEEILEEEGWERTDDGWERDGEALEFEISYFGDATPQASASQEMIQQQLAEVGINVTLRDVPIAEMGTLQSEGTYDVIWANLTRADPDILRARFDSTTANPQRLSASEIDDLLAAQSAEPDPEARAEIVAEAQEKITAEYLSVPVLESTAVLASREAVHGVRFDSGSRIYLNDVWIDDAD